MAASARSDRGETRAWVELVRTDGGLPRVRSVHLDGPPEERPVLSLAEELQGYLFFLSAGPLGLGLETTLRLLVRSPI